MYAYACALAVIITAFIFATLYAITRRSSCRQMAIRCQPPFTLAYESRGSPMPMRRVTVQKMHYFAKGVRAGDSAFFFFFFWSMVKYERGKCEAGKVRRAARGSGSVKVNAS